MHNGYLNGIKIVGITVAVFLGMKFILPQVVPFLIAVILVKIVWPGTLFLQRCCRMKKAVAGVVILTLLLAAAGIAAWILGMSLWKQICNLGANLEIYTLRAEQFVSDCCQMVERRTGIRALEVEDFIYENLEVLEERVQAYTVPDMVKNSISYMMAFMEWMGILLVIFISVVLILKDYDEIQEKLKKYPFYGRVRRILSAMGELGGAWLKAQLIIILLVTIICVIGLWILRYPYALLMGIVIGVTDAIPFIGTGTFLVPWAIYLFLTGKMVYAVCLLVIFALTYVLREFLEPKLIGDKIGIYPIVMVITIYLGLNLYGIAGVFLGPVSYLLIVQIYKETEAGTTKMDKMETTGQNGKIV